MKTHKLGLLVGLLSAGVVLAGCTVTGIEIYSSGSGYIVIPHYSSETSQVSDSSEPSGTSSAGASSVGSSSEGTSSEPVSSSESSSQGTSSAIDYKVETVQNDLTLFLASPKSVVWNGYFTLKSNYEAEKTRLFAIELPAELAEYVSFDQAAVGTINGSEYTGGAWKENEPVAAAALPTMKYTAKGVEAGNDRKAFEAMQAIMADAANDPVILYRVV